MANLRAPTRIISQCMKAPHIRRADTLYSMKLARQFAATTGSEIRASSFSRQISGFSRRQKLVQQRGMVTITKTKSSELPPQEKDESPSTADVSDYKILSDELVITPSCLARVDKLIQQRRAKEGESSFLRVFVDAGGCSGFQYQFELDQEFDPDEDIALVVSESEDVPKIVVDETSLGFLHGSTLDFAQEMIKSAFVVSDNPNSESACGCGSSFAVKNFAANPALD